jgi:hypothetical protein
MLRPIILLILSAIPCQCIFSAQPVTVTGAELVEFGVYRRYGLKFEIPPHIQQRRFTEARELKLIKQGDVIPAALGTAFGITYILDGTPPNAEVEVEFEVLHPPTLDRKTGRPQCVKRQSAAHPSACLLMTIFTSMCRQVSFLANGPSA